MSTDISEKGLELIIASAMTGLSIETILARVQGDGVKEEQTPGLHNWLLGDPKSYVREWCVDLEQLTAFLKSTQSKVAEALDLDHDSPIRREFLQRLFSETGKRGVIDVMRKGVDHKAHHVDLFYATPSPDNERAIALNALNRFSVTRQLCYSENETKRALDMATFINGLPVATFELKNNLTKQTVQDAIEQYKRDRDPNEPLFRFGRCIVHFAVDDAEVRMCTELAGKASWFLPLNKGHNDGAGNPPNPSGIKTDYLWKHILAPMSLTDIIENYAQVVEEVNPKTGKKKRKQIFPRYHQLDVVRELLKDAAKDGVGQRYLIQHSAGSGKSNSIAWLAHQLIGVKRDGRDLFDTVIVVTDRKILDKQLRDNIRQFAQVGATIGAVTEGSAQLKQYIQAGKKIIISTVQKFPVILQELGDEHRDRRFAIIIDEAHSSQGGKTSNALNAAVAELGDADKDPEDDAEDKINAELERRMAARKMPANVSYFAFTATPKNKTLELFGRPVTGPDGKTQHAPRHEYTMKQAIQEGFILDVLKSYAPVKSYYKLVKTIEGDPEFEIKRAAKKLRKFVESNEHAIRIKAEIMVDHFQEQVIGLQKVGGQARAMVVTSGIERAIQYFMAIREYLKDRKSQYKAIVAFSGEHEYGGAKVTEASLNGFPSSEIADRFSDDPACRFLICADKFQTGYDEPLLHTMYVDKPLSSVKAVQTLSRLNRAHPKKHDVFVLDFLNEAETIQKAFEPYYRSTILSEETDANKLHNLKAALEGAQVFFQAEVDDVVRRYLSGASREELDPTLDVCRDRYNALDEDGQVDFKGKTKAFVRSYEFLGAILPYTNTDWEKLSIFLNLLLGKLPPPKEEDFARGILETIDMDSYRAEKNAVMSIQLPDQDALIDPVPVEAGGFRPEPEMARLSSILKGFNERFGTLFSDADRVAQRIREDIAPKVAADEAFQNAKANTPAAARIEHDRALEKVMLDLLKDDTEIYKQFVQNEAFKRYLTDIVFQITSAPSR
jgi:type I restriction enzyme, R subunit